jgi:DNA polymerase-3 subunit delta'
MTAMPFAGIAGHQRLISLLSRAIVRGTLPSSLLFAGPRGVGKRRTALALAQAVNCLEPRKSESAGARMPLDACGRCPSCSRIARGMHPDVIVVEPGDTGSIKIEQVREVIDRSAYRPFEGRRRVTVIDEADAMAEAAQSALLKTLEEPSASSLFVLVSAMPDVLLPTVRSRCSTLRFGRLTSADVAGVLVREHEFNEREAHAAAADADGSIGAALEAQGTNMAEARAVAQELLERASRLTQPIQLLDLAKDLTGKGGTPAEERDRLTMYLRTLSSLLRDVSLLAVNGEPGILANSDLQSDLARLATAFGEDRSARAFAAVDLALDAIARNASPKMVADWLAVQL